MIKLSLLIPHTIKRSLITINPRNQLTFMYNSTTNRCKHVLFNFFFCLLWLHRTKWRIPKHLLSSFHDDDSFVLDFTTVYKKRPLLTKYEKTRRKCYGRGIYAYFVRIFLFQVFSREPFKVWKFWILVSFLIERIDIQTLILPHLFPWTSN